MSLTTIPLQQETRNKLKQIANKTESWDAVLNRLYDHEITRMNAQVFFNVDTLSLDEAIEEINKW